jgi:hypothetical protein
MGRRGITATKSPSAAALSMTLLAPSADGSNPPTGSTYGGLTPTVYVAPYASVSSATSDYDQQTFTDYNNATSESTPCTLGCAMRNITPGAIIGLLNGVYYSPVTGERWEPAFEPFVSGTAANPIIIVAKYRAALNYGDTTRYSEIRTNSVPYTPPATSTSSPAIGGDAKDYITYDGIFTQFSQSFPGATGGSICVVNSDFCNVRYCVVPANRAPNTSNHNANAVYSEGSTNLTIENNIFVGNGNSHHNQACIETYSTTDLIIRNNLFDCTNGYGIFIKGATTVLNGDVQIYFNDLRNVGVTILDCDTADVYQNLITGNVAVAGYTYEGGEWHNIRVYNNTIVVTGSSVLGVRVETQASPTPGGNRFYNNIVVVPNQAVSEIVNGGDSGAGVTFDTFDRLDYNMYYASGGTSRYSTPGDPHTGITEWRAGLLAEGAVEAARDTNSTEANPLFVGSGDYHLQSGSPALTAGNTGGPIGCYITGNETIGVG